MWVELVGDSGQAIFVNFSQISALCQPAEGAPGCRLAFLNGATVAVRHSPAEVRKMIDNAPMADRGMWLALTNDVGKPYFGNFDVVRMVRPGPGVFKGSMLDFVGGFSHYARESVAEIGKALEAHEDRHGAAQWISLAAERKRNILVNMARLAAVSAVPGHKQWSFLRFRAGAQAIVGQSPDAVMRILRQRQRRLPGRAK